jgi:ribosomal protein L12E/L44/L45/RPP1/RPP2
MTWAKGEITADMLDDGRQKDALPSPLEADIVLRVGKQHVLHVEGQGYGDKDFTRRIFRYHLGFVLRYWPRRVHTVALWLIVPPASQRREKLVFRGVSARITTIVLPEVPAELLLADPRTVCFAAGAHPGQLSEEELCWRVARELRKNGACREEFEMARAAATMQKREGSMFEDIPMADPTGEAVRAIQAERMYVIKHQAQAEAKADALLSVLAARGIPVDEAARKQITDMVYLEDLDCWLKRAATATTLGEVLDAPVIDPEDEDDADDEDDDW